jgi:hypothetical protein
MKLTRLCEDKVCEESSREYGSSSKLEVPHTRSSMNRTKPFDYESEQ